MSLDGKQQAFSLTLLDFCSAGSCFGGDTLSYRPLAYSHTLTSHHTRLRSEREGKRDREREKQLIETHAHECEYECECMHGTHIDHSSIHTFYNTVYRIQISSLIEPSHSSIHTTQHVSSPPILAHMTSCSVALVPFLSPTRGPFFVHPPRSSCTHAHTHTIRRSLARSLCSARQAMPCHFILFVFGAHSPGTLALRSPF